MTKALSSAEWGYHTVEVNPSHKSWPHCTQDFPYPRHTKVNTFRLGDNQDRQDYMVAVLRCLAQVLTHIGLFRILWGSSCIREKVRGEEWFKRQKKRSQFWLSSSGLICHSSSGRASGRYQLASLGLGQDFLWPIWNFKVHAWESRAIWLRLRAASSLLGSPAFCSPSPQTPAPCSPCHFPASLLQEAQSLLRSSI